MQAQPWVAGVSVASQDGVVTWHVAVTDDEQAQSKLLRLLLADERVDVLAYGRQQHELEDVFVQLVQEG